MSEKFNRVLDRCYYCNKPVQLDEGEAPGGWFVDNKVYFIWPMHIPCSEEMTKNTREKDE